MKYDEKGKIYRVIENFNYLVQCGLYAGSWGSRGVSYNSNADHTWNKQWLFSALMKLLNLTNTV